MSSEFVVLEGGEGAGKTSVVEAAREEFPNVTFSREPGGVPLGEEIRNLVLGRDRLSPLTNLLLFSAARSLLAENVLTPTRQGGKHVVLDRYVASTFAYQIHGQQGYHLKGLFNEVYSAFGELAQPTLYIYMDVDVEVGLRRARGLETANHFEAKELEFHHRVHAGYREFFSNHKHVRVDANPDKKIVVPQVLEILRRHLA